MGDEREETMLDLVPFAGAGRQIANGDVNVEFGGESLEFELPQAHAQAVDAAAVSGDHQSPGVEIALAPHGQPPAGSN
jgi:hypothetical protein